MRKMLIFLAAILCLLMVSCGDDESEEILPEEEKDKYSSISTNGIANDDTSFGEDIEEELNKGYFEETINELTVTYQSGTKNAYKWDGNTLVFTKLTQDSVYSVSGKLSGNIVIDVGENYKLDLELCGASIVSEKSNPVAILSGNKVTITAKKDKENFIYDKREAVNSDDEGVHSATVYSVCDLELAGKGSLVVSSDNNNGIHTKDDLEIKNLKLTVNACDNALKGNDSVTLLSGNVTAIAKKGDGIKTTNSGISQKGKQQGTVSILGGKHCVYAACDGIDAAYNVEIDGAETKLNIYTDKYSNYSETVTNVDEGQCYIRFTSNAYKYSVKYYNSDNDFLWENANYHSTVSSGRQSYYYYSFNKASSYSKIQIFIYDSSMEQGQANKYVACTDYLTPNATYDTFALSTRNGSLNYSWTNYTTKINEGPGGFGGGPGGMNDGNTDKGDYSTKGIKAANGILISSGVVNVKSYDDSVHSGDDVTLENGSAPLGNITIKGGSLTVYSNDDGLHADNTLVISGGTIEVTNSYEGVEGNTVKITGGNVSIISKDDGVNATATSGTSISIQGGNLYIYCTGDGIDSNSRASYSGISFSGGNTVIISNSTMNSAIDSEAGYSYTGGRVLAIMPSGGMSSEATHCQNFSSVGINKTASIASGEYLTVSVSGKDVVTVKLPTTINSRVIYLGSSSASISTGKTTSLALNGNGVYWSN